MHTTYLERFAHIAVAVAFDRHAPDLVRMGAQIAARTGKRLCLIHSVEPWHEAPAPSRGSTHLSNVAQVMERNAAELAGARLRELRELLPPGLHVETHIVAGKPTEALGAEAARLGVALMIVGADLSQMRYVPRGFSTALSLMVTSPVPLFVVDTASCSTLPADGWRLLVADDLGEQTSDAVQFAFDFAAATRATTLHHLHVNGLSLTTLKAGIATAAVTAHTPIAATVSADEVHDALLATLEERLSERAAPMRDYLEAAGGEYVSIVATGIVADEVERCVQDVRPDIVIFGRHQAYHHRPFFIGRLPFRAMLEQRRPVIVVPNG